MRRIRSEVGKNLEMDRHAVASFICDNNGANAQTKQVCRPRTRFDIAKVEVYSVVKVATGTNTLDVCVGAPGVVARIVAAVDPNPVEPATTKSLTIAAQPEIPRTVQLTLADNAGINLKVSVVVTGLDAWGVRVTETLANSVAGAGVVAGVMRFREVRSAVVTIVAGEGDAADTVSLDTVNEKVITQFDPDTLTAGAAPVSEALLQAAYDIPGNTPVWVQLVSDNGSTTAPPDLGVVVHWQPYMGAYDGETAYGGYE
jgi:hypothetical protein